MAAPDVTKKLNIYHILYRLNRSFTAIVMHCRRLEEAGLFKSRVSRRYEGYAQELQAEINQEALDKLHAAELDDWARYGKVRLAREKELRDPNDLLIQEKERKEERKRVGR